MDCIPDPQSAVILGSKPRDSGLFDTGEQFWNVVNANGEKR